MLLYTCHPDLHSPSGSFIRRQLTPGTPVRCVWNDECMAMSEEIPMDQLQNHSLVRIVLVVRGERISGLVRLPR